MKRINLHNALSAGILVGATAVAASAVASPPQGNSGPDYGMGPGMMGGYGMGPGMMGGYASRADLNLTAEQRTKIAEIQNDVRRKHWDLMGKMQDEQAQMNEQYYSEQRDDAPLSKSYRNMSELRQQMFDLSLSARRQIDAVLTQEQRDKLKRG
jgi:Spy/CpxP family protein refolding chaperone